MELKSCGGGRGGGGRYRSTLLVFSFLRSDIMIDKLLYFYCTLSKDRVTQMAQKFDLHICACRGCASITWENASCHVFDAF